MDGAHWNSAVPSTGSTKPLFDFNPPGGSESVTGSLPALFRDDFAGLEAVMTVTPGSGFLTHWDAQPVRAATKAK